MISSGKKAESLPNELKAAKPVKNDPVVVNPQFKVDTYVACPYFCDPDMYLNWKWVMAERVRIVTDWMQLLWLKANVTAFSPLTHNDHIGLLVRRTDDPSSVEKVLQFDLTILSICKRIHILQLPGYEGSIGLKREFEFACKRQLEIQPITCEMLVRHKIVPSLDYVPYLKRRRIDERDFDEHDDEQTVPRVPQELYQRNAQVDLS